MLQLYRYMREPVGFAEECRHRYGPVYVNHIAGLPPMVYFALPEAAREIFANRGDTLYAGESPNPIEFLIGLNNVTRYDGERHQRERKLIMPSFHGERIVAYGHQMRVIVEDVIASWRPGQVLVLQRVFEEIALRVLVETVFGMVPGERYARMQALLRQLMSRGGHPGITMLGALVSGTRLHGFLGGRLAPAADLLAGMGAWVDHLPLVGLARCIRDLDELLYAEIADRRAVAQERGDMMSTLILARDEQGCGLSDLELRDEMMTLLVGGHDTTANTLCWATALLLDHPAARAEMHAEHARVFGQGALDPGHVRELKYLDGAIKESLRLYPITLGPSRLVKQPVTIAGYTLPEGVIASPASYLIQRDPALWPDPTRFEPARFVDQKAKPAEWFPFGGGLRTCLGMAYALYEMKVVLSVLFERAILQRLPGPLPRLAYKGSIILGPATPLKVRFEGVRKPAPIWSGGFPRSAVAGSRLATSHEAAPAAEPGSPGFGGAGGSGLRCPVMGHATHAATHPQGAAVPRVDC